MSEKAVAAKMPKGSVNKKKAKEPKAAPVVRMTARSRYLFERRDRRNKARNLRKHLRDHPTDNQANHALENVDLYNKNNRLAAKAAGGK
jgi:hypothetical protein